MIPKFLATVKTVKIVQSRSMDMTEAALFLIFFIKDRKLDRAVSRLKAYCRKLGGIWGMYACIFGKGYMVMAEVEIPEKYLMIDTDYELQRSGEEGL